MQTNIAKTIEPDKTETGGAGSGIRRFVQVTPEGDAVVIRNARKSYRCGETVLNWLNMTVPCGSIYGLLGNSGSGKTTILSCIVGLQKLDSGKIWIFGKSPGTGSIGVPGRNVGYMPQDISLFEEFNIRETLNYFGTLNRMTKDKIKQGIKRMISLLSLPKCSTRVGSLSGGEQRRVSLVVALLSNPELLVLDEPTVGLDPLIRQNIWLHLRQLVHKHRTTVIITTHYIEECRGADNIGIMRNGRLLEEGQTERLMLEYKTNNLEKMVLDLSRRADDNLIRDSSNAKDTPDANAPPMNMAKVLHASKSTFTMNDSLTRIRALTGKNFITLFRNPCRWIYTILVRLVLAIAMSAAFIEALGCLSQGRVPKDLIIGVVNGEINSSCDNFTEYGHRECNLEMLSCHFLSYLDHDIMHFEPHDNESSALAAVRDGSSWGYIKYPSNFSASLYNRVILGPNIDPEDESLNSSQFIVRLDDTNKAISTTIKYDLIMAFEKFATGLFKDCGLDERRVEYPLQFREPIFGNEKTNLQEFEAPGIALVLLYFFPIVATAIRHIREKKSGIFDRSLVAGVKMWEVMIAYMISEFCLIQVQALLTYLVITQMFSIHVLGNDVLVYILFVLSGYAGVALGFLLGLICTEEMQVTALTMGTFLPSAVLSGVLWPEEAMGHVMRQVVQLLPGTIPGEAARSITSRAWEFTHPHVWPGFAVLGSYIIGSFILIVVLSLRHR